MIVLSKPTDPNKRGQANAAWLRLESIPNLVPNAGGMIMSAQSLYNQDGDCLRKNHGIYQPYRELNWVGSGYLITRQRDKKARQEVNWRLHRVLRLPPSCPHVGDVNFEPASNFLRHFQRLRRSEDDLCT
jgi:hypothetical protein